MAERPRICAAILAAGRSKRFGDADKLAAGFRGKMLGLHVSDMLAPFEFDRKLVIAASANHPCDDGWRAAGFDVIVNPRHSSGIASSVALAAKHAEKANAGALFICLADMPLIPARHIADLAKAANAAPRSTIFASYDGAAASPPAIFPSRFFGKLGALQGDAGAREMLRRATHIHLESRLLADIDTVDDLRRLDDAAS